MTFISPNAIKYTWSRHTSIMTYHNNANVTSCIAQKSLYCQVGIKSFWSFLYIYFFKLFCKNRKRNSFWSTSNVSATSRFFSPPICHAKTSFKSKKMCCSSRKKKFYHIIPQKRRWTWACMAKQRRFDELYADAWRVHKSKPCVYSNHLYCPDVNPCCVPMTPYT